MPTVFSTQSVQGSKVMSVLELFTTFCYLPYQCGRGSRATETLGVWYGERTSCKGGVGSVGRGWGVGGWKGGERQGLELELQMVYILPHTFSTTSFSSVQRTSGVATLRIYTLR